MPPSAPMSSVDKSAIIADLRAQLAREIETLTFAAHQAREAATHEEAEPENDKDTRAIEAAYLAGAQADRVRDLQTAENALAFLRLRDFGPTDTVGLGALVELEAEDDATLLYFLAPQGGGMRSVQGGKVIQVVTPQSPLGQALVGRSEGESVEVRGPRGKRELVIVGLR